MKIAVIGASGRTGTAFCSAARDAGHQVIAVVRDPSRLAAPADEIRTADATAPAQLAAAIDGSDAVAWCVGPGRETPADIMQVSATATVEAMDAAKVARLVLITASGPYTVGDPWLLRRVLKPILWRFFGMVWRDMQATELVVRASGLDWTIMRPPQLRDVPARGYCSARDRNAPGLTIGRADLAQAMVDVLADDSTIGRAVSVASR